MDKVKQNYEEILELVFKISYLCLSFATFVSVIYISPVQPILVKLTLALGALVILVRVINWKKYRKMPCLILMVLFCLSFLLSTFMNRQYGMTDNLKWILWTGLQFFALYVCDVERDTEKYRKEFNVIAHLMIIGTAIAAAASLIMLTQSYSEFLTTAEGEFIVTGFTWDRLWGVYTDPNYGAVFSVIGVVLSVYFLLRQKGIKKVLYIITAILDFGYVIYSDSRTGEIAFVLCTGWLLYFYLIRKGNSAKDKKQKYIRCLKSILILICIMAVAVGGTSLLKTENIKYQTEVAQKAKVQKSLQSNKKSKKNTNKKKGTKKKKGTNKKKSEIETARQKNIENDATNGRFALWNSAIEVWETSPVYGAGYSTFVAYARENVSDTYAVNNDQGDYTSMHNAFFNALAFQGGIGFILLILITLRIIQYVFVTVIKEKDKLYLTAMLAAVGATGISMMFLLDGLYTNSPSACILWVFSGYLVQYTYKTRREEKV